MTMTTNRAVIALAVTISFAPPARAQQSVSDVLAFLVTNQSVRTDNFERDQSAARATSETISRALLANVSTLPVSTSSSGFLYRLNPELGTVERATRSFGPFFVERAITAGRGAASFGLTVQHMHFTSLAGRSLRNGSLQTTANQFVDESEPFDVDHLTLDIQADIATLYGNVGATENLEIGFAVPAIALRLNGSRIDTYYGRTFTQAKATATAIGLADAVVRTKYTLFRDAGSALATAVDVRLPTGREEDLLGTGATSLKLSGIGSLERGGLSIHANLGASVGGFARELSYGGAMAIAATDRLTTSLELVGRWMDSPGHIMTVAAPHPTLIGVQTLRLRPDSTRLNMVTLVPGFKWNVTATWVLVGSVSVPLTDAGLTAPFTPFVGVDYAIGR